MKNPCVCRCEALANHPTPLDKHVKLITEKYHVMYADGGMYDNLIIRTVFAAMKDMQVKNTAPLKNDYPTGHAIVKEYEIEQKTIDVIDKYLKHYNYKSMNDVVDKWLKKLDIQLKKLDRIGYECMSEAKSKQRNQNNTK